MYFVFCRDRLICSCALSPTFFVAGIVDFNATRKLFTEEVRSKDEQILSVLASANQRYILVSKIGLPRKDDHSTDPIQRDLFFEQQS